CARLYHSSRLRIRLETCPRPVALGYMFRERLLFLSEFFDYRILFLNQWLLPFLVYRGSSRCGIPRLGLFGECQHVPAPPKFALESVCWRSGGVALECLR